MANLITATGKRENTTQPLEFQNPTTSQWVEGTVDPDVAGGYKASLTGVAAGTYGPGGIPLKMRIKGLVAEYYYGGVGITVTNGGTTPVVTKLTAPTGLAATPTSATSVGVSWNNVTNASAYRLQRATDAAFTANVTLVYTSTGTSYVDNGVSAGTYYYRVLAEGTGNYSNSDYSAGVQAKVVPPVSGYDGRPGYVGAFGDSRVANQGFDGATGQTFAWPKVQNNNMNTGAGAGHYQFENLGQPSKGTDELLVAVDAYIKQRYDLVTYWRQVMPILVGVNDRLHHPEWDVSVSIENLRQIHLKLHAAGLPTIAMTEPHSYAFTQYPAWFRAYNDAIKSLAVSQWGCESVVDLENVASISNMLDKAISPDNLHFTTYGNTLLEAAITPFVNAYFAGQGMPTSSSGGSGDKITPAAPTISQTGRAYAATAGNGLAASTLRYRVKGGAEQTGSSYAVPDASSLAVGELVFRSVATGNYNDSPTAANTTAVAAINTSLLYNTDFTQPFAGNTTDGWFSTNDFGDGRQKVTIGDGAARFKGEQYDGISQQLHTPQGQAPAGNYKATIVVGSFSGGGRLSLQNMIYDQGSALNKSITAAGTVEFLFTTTGPGEVLKLKQEDAGTLAAIISFNVVPA